MAPAEPELVEGDGLRADRGCFEARGGGVCGPACPARGGADPSSRSGPSQSVASCKAMSDLERSRGSRPSRKQREQRAYRLVLATGTFGLIGVAGILLAILTSFSAFWPVVALIIAAICFMALRRTVR